MDEVRRDKLSEERRYDIGEQDDAFRNVSNEILGSGENYDVEDVVYEA